MDAGLPFIRVQVSLKKERSSPRVVLASGIPSLGLPLLAVSGFLQLTLWKTLRDQLTESFSFYMEGN